jgi:hypothetical protein
MQRLPLPLGGTGLLAGTGVYATKPSALEDLRNVSLRPNRTARRPGLFAVGSLLGVGGAVIGIHPLRALGVTAVVTYNTSTRQGKLHVVAPDYTPREVGTLWTLGAGAPFPRVSMADVGSRLFIAHDEANFGVRQATLIYTAEPSETIVPCH